MNPTLLWCPTPTRAAWQLGPLPPSAGRIDLVGWIEGRPRVDAGVPPSVAALLARALTDAAHVGVVIDPPPRLRWTREPSMVEAAFDDPRLPWWLQAQIFVLAERDDEPLDPERVLAWRDDAWTRHAAAHPNVGGVVRPGVDGEVAGIWTRAEPLRERLLNALERRAQEAARSWSRVDEPTFADRLRVD